MRNKNTIISILIGILCFFSFVADAMEQPDINSITFVIFEGYPGCEYGHAALRISGNGYDNLYELCRGIEMPRGGGDGPLKVWQNAVNSAIQERIDDGATFNLYRFITTSEQNEAALKHFQGLMKSDLPAGIRDEVEHCQIATKVYESKSGYHYLKSNCVITAIEVFEAGTGVMVPITNVGNGLSRAEKAVIWLEGWPDCTFLPQDLKYTLENHFNDIQNDISGATICRVDLY